MGQDGVLLNSYGRIRMAVLTSVIIAINGAAIKGKPIRHYTVY